MDSCKDFFPKENVKTQLGLKGFASDLEATLVMSLLGIHKLNRILRPAAGLKGKDFAQKAVDLVGVTPVISEADLAYIPKSGPCIICANHPYGGIDGFMMISAVGKVRPDFLVMVNFLVASLPVLQDVTTAVNPFEGGATKSVGGVRAAFGHVRNGGALIIFPAGQVSSDCNPEHVVKDIAWANGAMHLIQKVAAPVIPAFFDGCNSRFFHFIGKIHPRLRTIRLPAEVTNKRGTTVHLKFGKPVMPAELATYKTPEELGAYLRNRSYALEGLIPSSGGSVTPRALCPIEPHVSPEVLHAELAGLESSLLYRESGYSCYLNSYGQIPNVIREIGICREETFRQNGEGTGNPIDLDEYDNHYLHLHLWCDATGELVGAYRVGIGKEILESKGLNGFYCNQFFHFKDSFIPTLRQSIELGRSFIVQKYQTVPNALKMLLFQGVGRLGVLYPDAKRFIGPASLSSDIPKMFSSIMVEYFRQTSFDRELSQMTEPGNPFTPDFGKLDIDALNLSALTVDQFDKTLSRLSGGSYRLPPLVRAYAKANCRFIAFNVDKDFNDCIDALVTVEL